MQHLKFNNEFMVCGPDTVTPPNPLWLLQLPDIKYKISTGVTIRLKKVWLGVLVLYVHELKLIILNNYQTTKF